MPPILNFNCFLTSPHSRKHITTMTITAVESSDDDSMPPIPPPIPNADLMLANPCVLSELTELADAKEYIKILENRVMSLEAQVVRLNVLNDGSIKIKATTEEIVGKYYDESGYDIDCDIECHWDTSEIQAIIKRVRCDRRMVMSMKQEYHERLWDTLCRELGDVRKASDSESESESESD